MDRGKEPCLPREVKVYLKSYATEKVERKKVPQPASPPVEEQAIEAAG